MNKSNKIEINYWYLVGIIAFAFFLFILVQLLAFTAAYKAGEFLIGNELIEEHKKRGGLYQTALGDNTYTVGSKLERLREFNDAKILAIGSSRALLFEPEMFSLPFVNLGMSIAPAYFNYVAEQIDVLSDPQYAIVAMDFWWFHPKNEISLNDEISIWSFPNLYSLNTPGRIYYTSRTLMENFSQWLISGKVTPEDLVKLSMKISPLDNKPFKHLGVAGILNQSGVDLRGVYYYAWPFEDEPTDPPIHFRNIVRRIDMKTQGFEAASHTTDLLWNTFLNFVRKLEEQGITVITFIPPVGKTIAEKMSETGNYKIIDDIDRRARLANLNFLNFHNPSTLGSDDCEFLDGIHGGEVTYRRIVNEIAKRYPETIGRHINSSLMSEQIVKFSGKALARNAHYGSSETLKEKDFLGIGCKK